MYVTPDNRFPHLTAIKLEQTLGLKVNGINAALSGNNSMHSLLLLLGKVVPLRPNFVVLMHGINDIGTLTAMEPTGSRTAPCGCSRRKRPRGAMPAKCSSEISSPTRRSSCSTAPRRCARSWPSARSGTSAAIGRRVGSAGGDGARLRELTQVLRAGRHRLGHHAGAHDQVYVEPPSEAERSGAFVNREQLAGGSPQPGGQPNLLDDFNAITREVARSEVTPLVDLARARTWRYGDVYDGVHFHREGSKRVAEIVAAALKEQIDMRGKVGSARTP